MKIVKYLSEKISPVLDKNNNSRNISTEPIQAFTDDQQRTQSVEDKIQFIKQNIDLNKT